MARRLTVVQMLPALESGGVERGTLEVGRHLVAQGHRSIVISAPGRLCQRLIDEGSEHVAWDVGRKHPWTLRWVRRLRRLLDEQGVDVLHLRSRLPAWIGWLAWNGMNPARRPCLVTTVHGFYTVGRYSAVMTRGERVIAVSGSVRDYVLANYPNLDPDRLRVIHRGVDPLAFPVGHAPSAEWLARWRQQFPWLEGRYVVTLPARVTRWKGQALFIDLVAELIAHGADVHGLIVGGHDARRAPFVAELEATIRERGLGDRLTLTGHRDDLREVMAVSDAVVSMSTDPEAFGRTTLEALSLGVPVAGFDHGGVGEQLAAMLPEGRVPVGDVGAMAEMLLRWRQQPPAIGPVGVFTQRAMVDAVLATYLELAASPGGAPDAS